MLNLKIFGTVTMKDEPYLFFQIEQTEIQMLQPGTRAQVYIEGKDMVVEIPGQPVTRVPVKLVGMYDQPDAARLGRHY